MLTDAILDAARMRGDVLADDTVAAVFKAGDTAAVAKLLSTLMRDDQQPGALPAPVLDYLDQTSALAPRSSGEGGRAPGSVATGERVFAEHGPEVMMLLCCYSLPSSYAAKKGVQVLHRTAYLAKRPNRRLFETSQFIVDVLSPGGLGPGGRGVRTAQKVRLMHAAIRHLIRVDTASPWDVKELGVPINQEDVLGTLMTFSYLILDGLARLGVKLTPQEQQAFLDTWLAVGRLVGIEPQLLPRTVAEAKATTDLIERRQIAESPQGRDMTAALLGMMESNLPHPFKSMPGCLIREFVPPNVATFLGIPSHPLREEMIRLADETLRPLQRFIDFEAKRHALVRTFSIHLLRWMLTVELDGRPASFAIPDALQQDWQIAPPDSEESFWDKIKHRIDRLL
jgi:ER-bound oxygenase mpaB/B'/Rubber oxygenase, catalytic domain